MRPSDGERGTEEASTRSPNDHITTIWGSFIPAMVGCDQPTGREAPKPRRLRLDLRTTAEPQPELIHTKRGSRTGTLRARTSGSQTNLLTSPRRTRKNKGWVSTLAARLQSHWINLKSFKVVFSLHMGDIYTRNNPPRWVETRKQTKYVANVKGSPEMTFWVVSAWLFDCWAVFNVLIITSSRNLQMMWD
jgi:hypothetical protein